MSYVSSSGAELGAVTDDQLEQDDVNTLAAAMAQAKATGKNVTVKLSDGTSQTVTPTDLDSQGTNWLKYALIGGGTLVGLGLMGGTVWFAKRGARRNPELTRWQAIGAGTLAGILTEQVSGLVIGLPPAVASTLGLVASVGMYMLLAPKKAKKNPSRRRRRSRRRARRLAA